MIDINNEEDLLRVCDFDFFYNSEECSRELCMFYNDIQHQKTEFDKRQAKIDLTRIAIKLKCQYSQIECLKEKIQNLEHRLSNCIEPKYKVGDKCWAIRNATNIYDEPKNAFVADFIGESNIYSGTIVGNKKVRFLNHTFDCVDEFQVNEKVDVVLRPEDIILGEQDAGMVNGKLVSKTFKGVHYEYVMMVGRSEVVIQSTDNIDINKIASFKIDPNNIHIMKKEFVSNKYEAWIDKNNNVVISEEPFECDITQLIPNSYVDEEGYLVDPQGLRYDFTDADVIAEIGLKVIEVIDNEEDGVVSGEIISIIYKGDHYQIIVRTDEDEDFVIDTEYTWNEHDMVSLKVNPKDIKLTLKAEVKNYVKD